MAKSGCGPCRVTSRLTALVEHGILERDPPGARRAEYRLTPAGRELAPLMAAMRQWGENWLFDKHKSPVRPAGKPAPRPHTSG
ncbi:MAG: helix-turn-helix transcriptional regulator [Sphingomonadales bacterium]|nr:helix-turn-helix transcriptional regulator [Sphingomonadales bacterium]NCQ20692.1 helix-turn-helix transcriptional regulator [Sphingomonadales bacterium]NCT04827.1 helix-turn-helix transcriptional regulator [Sphingomonadales bacterium]